MNDLTSKYVRPGQKHNPNLAFLRDEMKNYRILAMPGGTRSGKTYSAIQWHWGMMDAFSGIKFSIVRGTYPALKATVMEDFVEIGRSAGLYTSANHHFTNSEYRHNGNLLDYFSAEDHEKVRGRKRNILYMNEAPEIPWKVAEQLLWRTTDRIILDYNPSYPTSWVYENILPRADCAFITTTFLDNPHLTAGQLAELEWMRINDPETYKVYGLGQRGELRGQVYSAWKTVSTLPEEYPGAFIVDFGYTNDPACIAEFRRHNKALWGKEHAYGKGLNNIDLGILLHFAGATQDSIIIADSAEPKSVSELRYGWDLSADDVIKRLRALIALFRGNDYRDMELYQKLTARMDQYVGNPDTLATLQSVLSKGYPVLLALKGPDSIDTGIQRVKQHEVFMTADSVNAWREFRAYRWAEDKKTGALLNQPIDESNHFMDCLRYYALAIGRLV